VDEVRAIQLRVFRKGVTHGRQQGDLHNGEYKFVSPLENGMMENSFWLGFFFGSMGSCLLYWS